MVENLLVSIPSKKIAIVIMIQTIMVAVSR